MPRLSILLPLFIKFVKWSFLMRNPSRRKLEKNMRLGYCDKKKRIPRPCMKKLPFWPCWKASSARMKRLSCRIVFVVVVRESKSITRLIPHFSSQKDGPAGEKIREARAFSIFPRAQNFKKSLICTVRRQSDDREAKLAG